LAAPAAPDDQLVRFLVLRPRALAERRHAPRRHRVTAALRLALAAAVRVVDGVHRGAAHGRALAEPAAAAGLATGDVAVVDVAHLPDGGATGQQHPAHLTRRQPERRVAGVLRDELDPRSRGARHLAALARLQLDFVAGLELDDGLLPALLRAADLAAALRLRLHLDDVDAGDLDLEQLLDSLAHLCAVRVVVDAKRVFADRGAGVALLGDDRREQDLR